ncbi:hypothetical protein LCGC14_2010810 [marine sediment metagenome]|uniref:Uncharacterized protein n=1 Tax=marine sediment metagenome TaxID=412755 RepID=A0A0F9HXM8_9ZZZZ
MMYTMNHYCTREKDGTVHVQNAVMGIMGQHHVHTPNDFAKWRKDVDNNAIEWLDCDPCDCGLKAGEVRAGK